MSECTGSEAVIAQGWETLAWLISPPVVSFALILMVCAAIMLMFVVSLFIDGPLRRK